MRLSEYAETVACPACGNYGFQLVDAKGEAWSLRCQHCENMTGTFELADGHWDERLTEEEQ